MLFFSNKTPGGISDKYKIIDNTVITIGIKYSKELAVSIDFATSNTTGTCR
jgi:hypothetical protein